jgi:hypothetical protein
VATNAEGGWTAKRAKELQAAIVALELEAEQLRVNNRPALALEASRKAVRLRRRLEEERAAQGA